MVARLAELGPLGVIGYGAFGVVLVLWLVISFSKPGRGRSVLEWLGATHLYVALVALFVHLVLRSNETGSLLGQIAFGFLAVVFVLGFCVSLVNTFRAMGGGASAGGGSATH